MLAGINYCRLLWKLYGMKRNAGRTKEQIERLQKRSWKSCSYTLMIIPLITGGHLRQRAFLENISG